MRIPYFYFLQSDDQHVPTPKEALDTKLGLMLGASTLPRTISRRLFLYDFNQSFLADTERGFKILNQISEKYRLPFSSIRVAGSSQVGYSYFANREFTPQVSDLDIAIVSSQLFQQYSELVYWTTRRYTDLTGFPIRKHGNTYPAFRDNLAAGFFRPDLMPNSKQKDDWFSFFTNLSNEHTDLYKNINAGIYLSETFFEMRNATIVDEFQKAHK